MRTAVDANVRSLKNSRPSTGRVARLSPRSSIAITARDARPVTRPIKHWLFTGLSFAAVIGVSAYMIAEWWDQGSLTLPLRSHVLAAAAVLAEIVARSLKLTWSANAVRMRLPFIVSVRTSLAGDFGGSIPPARSRAEPARFLVLVEAGIAATNALVILFAEILLEALSLALVVLVVAIVFRDAGKVLGALVGVVGLYAGVVLGVAALALVLAKRAVAYARPRWAARIG